jgi:hypothetical protein
MILPPLPITTCPDVGPENSMYKVFSSIDRTIYGIICSSEPVSYIWTTGYLKSNECSIKSETSFSNDTVSALVS